MTKILEKLHKLLFGYDAEIQIYGWEWHYWCYAEYEEVCPEGGYISVVDGIFCFQRRYAV